MLTRNIKTTVLNASRHMLLGHDRDLCHTAAHPQDTFFTHRVAFSGIGVAFNGVKFDAPAPTDAILAADTLAPFDDCGGHVNLHAGYHYHAVTGCNKEVASSKGHAPVIGIAMDGYQIHGRLNADGNEPDDLDGCRGHEIEGLPYHDHVNAPGKNEILGCFKAETGCSSEDPDAICDATRKADASGRCMSARGGFN